MTTSLSVTNSTADAGLAASWTGTIDNFQTFITGDTPTLVQTDERVTIPANTTIAPMSVVGINGSGQLVLARLDDDGAGPNVAVQAIGITITAIANATGNAVAQTVQVYRAGCFNPDVLVWHATFDTDEKKRVAFNGAPTPTQVVLRKPRHLTPTT